MALLLTVVILGFVAAVMYWPLLIKNRAKQDFVGAVYYIPVLLVVGVMVILFRSC